jgi:hypothetical protein
LLLSSVLLSLDLPPSRGLRISTFRESSEF